MSHVPHELSEEFPSKAAAIHALRLSDAHFARLADEYHEVNRSLHRMETNVEPTDDFVMEELKKRRLKLIDTLSTILANA